jgi:hypothetical protein
MPSIVLRCSACGAEVAHGAQSCSGCGLPLSAQAVPAVVSERGPLLSTAQVVLAVLCGGFLLMWLLTSINANHQQAAQADQEASAAQKVTDFNRSLARIATPAAFEAKCGHATWRKRVNGYPALVYDEPIPDEPRGSETLTVVFAVPGDPGFRGQLYGTTQLLTAREALSDIHCSL